MATHTGQRGRRGGRGGPVHRGLGLLFVLCPLSLRPVDLEVWVYGGSRTRGSFPCPFCRFGRSVTPRLARPDPGARTRKSFLGKQGGRYARGRHGGAVVQRQGKAGKARLYIKRRSVRLRRGLQLLSCRRRTKAQRTAEHGAADRAGTGMGLTGSSPCTGIPSVCCLPGFVCGGVRGGCGRAGEVGVQGAQSGMQGAGLRGDRQREPVCCRRALCRAACRAGTALPGAPRFPPALAVFSPRHGGSAGYCRRLDEL